MDETPEPMAPGQMSKQAVDALDPWLVQSSAACTGFVSAALGSMPSFARAARVQTTLGSRKRQLAASFQVLRRPIGPTVSRPCRAFARARCIHRDLAGGVGRVEDLIARFRDGITGGDRAATS
jgi:hypothetical protein